MTTSVKSCFFVNFLRTEKLQNRVGTWEKDKIFCRYGAYSVQKPVIRPYAS